MHAINSARLGYRPWDERMLRLREQATKQLTESAGGGGRPEAVVRDDPYIGGSAITCSEVRWG